MIGHGDRRLAGAGYDEKVEDRLEHIHSTAAAAPERPARACEMPYIMVLITVGVVGSEPPSTCMMPCAIATTSAAADQGLLRRL